MVTQEQKDIQEQRDEAEQLGELAEESIYDDTPEAGVDGLYGLKPNDGLLMSEMVMASSLALLSRGVMIVHGKPGCGKGVFGAYMGWKLRRFFKNKKVMLDYLPRRIFDYGREDKYLYFSPQFMMNEIDKMAVELNVNLKQTLEPETKLNKKDSDTVSYLAKKWREKNERLLKSGVLELDELKRYLYNRNPNNKLGKMIGNVVSVWRHLDLLVLGMCPNIQEIDKNNFLAYVTHEVKPEWCKTRRNTTLCRIRRLANVGVNGVVQFESKSKNLFIDGAKPRPEMGVQLMRPEMIMGEPEQRIVDVLRSKNGFANLNEISDLTDEDINECRLRLLNMHGKDLKMDDDNWEFTNIVRCMGVFNLFNSKDIKNINPKMAKTEE
jgi:hypothetical protein